MPSNVISLEYWKRKKQNEDRLKEIDELFHSPYLNRHLYTIKNNIVIWYNEKEELENYFKQKLFACHRLDRETSGLIIYAKQAWVQSAITQEFRRGEIKKGYIALVRGKLKKKERSFRRVCFR